MGVSRETIEYRGNADVEMAATYHSVIGMVKLHGSFVWNFIGIFLISLMDKRIVLTWFLTKSP